VWRQQTWLGATDMTGPTEMAFFGQAVAISADTATIFVGGYQGQ